MERCFRLVPSSTFAYGQQVESRDPGYQLQELHSKRPRGKLACQICHERKVRCNVMEQFPCSNCRAFVVKCEVHIQQELDLGAVECNERRSIHPQSARSEGDLRTEKTASPTDTRDSSSFDTRIEWPAFVPYSGDEVAVSCVSPLFSPRNFDTTCVSKAPKSLSPIYRPLNIQDFCPKPSAGLASAELVHIKGALLLPPRWLRKELINAYFTWIAPVLPIINRNDFVQRFVDEDRPPSYLLMQSVLLAGCRVCEHPLICDADGSTKSISRLFYRRAKALYDAGYETDRRSIVQALILLGWYWEGPEVAIAVAQGSGMHRSKHTIPENDKRLRKRIWWTLFCRDRTLALARGRPFTIRRGDTDMETLAESDFQEENTTAPILPCDRLAIQFFLHLIDLCDIISLILEQRRLFSANLVSPFNAKFECHYILEHWYQNLPEEFRWDPLNYELWPSVLQLYYYSTLCLIHLLPTYKGTSAVILADVGHVGPFEYSRASMDAPMISCILAKLRSLGQITFVPCFTVYSCCIAMVVHANNILSSGDEHIRNTHYTQMMACMDALRDLSKCWLLAESSLTTVSPTVYWLAESCLEGAIRS